MPGSTQNSAGVDRRIASPFCAPGFLRGPYAGLGDFEAALNSLELGLAQGESFLLFMREDPSWDPLRSHPRFARLLERLGLSDEQMQRNRFRTLRGHG